MKPEVSVIVNMYQHAHLLRLCLESLSCQTFKNFEVIVADDGSGPAVKEVVDSFKKNLNIIHIWQEDKGFRKCLIQNKAVLVSSSEKLFFVDGDIVFHPKAIEEVFKNLEEGFFVVSRVVRLSPKATRKILQENFPVAKVFSKGFLMFLLFDWIFGKPRTKYFEFGIYLHSFFARIVKNLKKHKEIKGGCWAISKKDFEKVNGFDNFWVGWGHEDHDIYWRLHWSGVKAKLAVNKVVGFHLWHKKRPEGAGNKEKEILTKVHRKTAYENGLKQIKKEDIIILR